LLEKKRRVIDPSSRMTSTDDDETKIDEPGNVT
jgi:hypothetical protein